MTFKATYPACAFNGDGKHIGPGPWLDVIHKANGFAHDEDRPSLFGEPTWSDALPHTEIYADANVRHDFPLDETPMPTDVEYGGIEWERASRERSRAHTVWTRDMRNTVTIYSKTPLGERLLAAAHAEVVGP